jgi:hypothetical protein
MTKSPHTGPAVLNEHDRFPIEDTHSFRQQYRHIGAFLVKRNHAEGRHAGMVVAMSEKGDFAALQKAFLKKYPDEREVFSRDYICRHGPAAFERIIKAGQEDATQDHTGRLNEDRNEKGPPQVGG